MAPRDEIRIVTKIGEAAMNLLLAVLEGRPIEQRKVLLRSELILRNSVARFGGSDREIGTPGNRRSV